MPFDGNGVYRPLTAPNFPAIPDTTIQAAAYNNQINDLAQALSACVTRSGESPAQADLPMAGKKHTNVGEATNRTNYARVAEVQDGTYTYLTNVTGTNNITAQAPMGLGAYKAGQGYSFVAAGANTGAATLSINGLAPKPLTRPDGAALRAGDIPAGAGVQVLYVGDSFQILTPYKLTKADVGLANVDNTSDANKPVSAAVQAKFDALPVFASTAENVAGTAEGKMVDPLGIREAFNATGSAPVYACRAWVNFNGTGTVSIRSSGNVSSITDNGVGDYTINFTKAMPDANYSVAGSCTCFGPTNNTNATAFATSTPYSNASIRVLLRHHPSNTPFDQPEVSVSVHR